MGKLTPLQQAVLIKALTKIIDLEEETWVIQDFSEKDLRDLYILIQVVAKELYGPNYPHC